MKRPLLLPLVPLYGAALLFKRRLLTAKPKRLTRPVISVGSLSSGGAGKTPVILALADLLTRNGYAVDVLSRGYRRSSKTVERVDPEGTAARFGDEPLEIAQRSAVAVYVGADRYAAGLLAEQDAHGTGRLHLLDDGLQHRRLARELDVVLLTLEDCRDTLLPAGNLREPLRRLGAASVVIVREDEAAALRPIVAQLAGGRMPVWIIRRQLEARMGTIKRPLAFCGIARPDGFKAMLAGQGVASVETIAFVDHHAYRFRDLTRLVGAARRAGADGFVTTTKDAVKLTKTMRKRLEEFAPLVVAGLTVSFLEEDAVLAAIAAATAQDSTRDPLT